ncbi:MAG: DUF115 domain-containing protein [Methylocystaceae bacterium]|nr:DUF115 domain-containing protein [Methylocystaceae bacterium]
MAISSFAETLVEQMNSLTLERVGQQAIKNAHKNQLSIEESNPIQYLKDSGLPDNDTALVIAAGPSLHRNDTAKMIKGSNFDGTIIVTESSMAWCLRNKIIPHVVVTVDPHPERIVRWFGDPKLNQQAIDEDDYFSRQDMDPSFRDNQLAFNNDLINLINEHGKEMRIAISSSASPAVVQRAQQSGMDTYWWNPFFDDYDAPESLTREVHRMNGLPCINAGGNVGTACWVIAHALLSKSRVGLLGMDFSYYGDTTYKETQYYTELLDLLGEDNLSKGFVHFQNPHTNTEFFTDPAYLWYRSAFLEMAEMASSNGVKTYNCTGGGILFGEGIETCSFEEFIKPQQ